MSDKKPDAKPEGEAKAAAADAGKGGSEGGIKSWLPLIVTIVLMPVLAFATTKFLILPKVVQAREGAAGEEGHEEAAEESSHGEKKEGEDSSIAIGPTRFRFGSVSSGAGIPTLAHIYGFVFRRRVGT